MTNTIYKKITLNKINTLTAEIEETFNDEFSVLVYDDNNSIWVEKFVSTYKLAEVEADKLITKYTKLYNLHDIN